MAWAKMVDPMFIKHLNEGITFVLGFVKVMQYPFQSFKRYVIDPKAFLGYPEWGIASSFNISSHEHYPFEGVAQND
jgi:hypothetical protein